MLFFKVSAIFLFSLFPLVEVRIGKLSFCYISFLTIYFSMGQDRLSFYYIPLVRVGLSMGQDRLSFSYCSFSHGLPYQGIEQSKCLLHIPFLAVSVSRGQDRLSFCYISLTVSFCRKKSDYVSAISLFVWFSLVGDMKYIKVLLYPFLYCPRQLGMGYIVSVISLSSRFPLAEDRLD